MHGDVAIPEKTRFPAPLVACMGKPSEQDDGVRLEGLILILWEGTTVCVGSTGTACWGQLVCTDLAGGVAAS